MNENFVLGSCVGLSSIVAGAIIWSALTPSTKISDIRYERMRNKEGTRYV